MTGNEDFKWNIFSGEFTWSGDDTTVYYKGNVPEVGRVYAITIGGAAGAGAAISWTATPTGPAATRMASR